MVVEGFSGEFHGSNGAQTKYVRETNQVPGGHEGINDGYYPEKCDRTSLYNKAAKDDVSSVDSCSSSSGKGSTCSSVSNESINAICDGYSGTQITYSDACGDYAKSKDTAALDAGHFYVSAEDHIADKVCNENYEILNECVAGIENELEDEEEGGNVANSPESKNDFNNLLISTGDDVDRSICGEKDAGNEDYDDDLVDDGFDDVDDDNRDYSGDENSDEDDDDLDVRSFLARMDAEIDNDNLGEDETCGSYNPAIDRGYAWIIVIAVFFIHFLLIGYHRAGGVFFVEFQRQFHSSASMTSLVIGLTEGVYSISALTVLGFLVKFVPVRHLCLIGSLVLVLGVIGNSLFDRIEFLILTHSLGSGLAGGLVNGPSIVIINEYFHKRRALATSLATTGASCGGVVFPFLARLLLDNYSFGGGLILTGGVVMHLFVFSMLLIPVKNHVIKTNSAQDNGVINQATNQLSSKAKSRSSILDTLKQRWVGAGDQISMSFSFEVDPDTKSNSSRNQIVHPPQNNQYNKLLGSGVRSLPLEQFSSKLEICEEGVPLKIQPEYHAERILLETPGDLTDKNILSDATSLTSQYSHVNESICSSSHQDGSRNRLDVIYSNPNELEVPSTYTSNLFLPSRLSSSKQTLSRSILFKSTSTLNNTIADLISTDQDYRRTINIQPGDKKTDITGFRKLYASLCDTPILRSASFWALFPFYFAATVGVALPQMYLVPMAKERGLTDDQASFCLSLMNVMDIVSHVLPGVIVNCGLMKSTTVCIVPILVVSLMGQLTPFFTSYATILSMSVVYGLCGGFYYAMQSVIIVETVGIDNFTSCIGIYYVVIGVAGAISFPIAGSLKDMTGSYSTTYHYLASLAFLAVLVLTLLPLAKRYDVRRGVLKS